MSGLFKTRQPDIKTPPSKDDERQRLAALQAREVKGGSGTTLLTRGLASPAVRPAGTTAKPTLMTG